MNVSHTCEIPRDTGYFNACQICGVPTDASYFDVAGFEAAPANLGQEIELASYTLHSQYCGSLLHFAQYAEKDQISPDNRQVLSHTPGYEWFILCNNQPRSPYLPTSSILNPWGYTAFPVHLRLEEGCTLRFMVRKVAPPAGQAAVTLSTVGGRLMGRYWYNVDYGGAPQRL
jgi:hypothetical protein